MELIVADDEASIRMILAKQGEQFGYTVRTAADGTQARNLLLASDTPRVALIDWMMPGLTGLEICRIVRDTPMRFQPYIVILTARSQPADAAAALDAGADDFMRKPYSPVELRARLGVGRRYLEAAEQVKILSGLLPICSCCKRIRDDGNYWHQIETYLEDHTNARLSHSLCPDCMKKEYPELAERILQNMEAEEQRKPKP